MRTLLTIVVLVTLIASSCGKGDYKKLVSDPILYCKTVKKLNDIVLENNFPPMIASRNYAYASIAAFECVAAGDSNYHSLSGQIKHMPAMPKPAPGEIDFHLAALLAFTKVGNAVTFPEGSMMAHYDQLVAMADDAGMPSDMLDNSKAFSDTIFSTIMKWSKEDNYAQTRSASKYTVTEEDGRWVPTPPTYTSGIEPHWMEIRTMALDSGSECRPVPPPLYTIKDTTSVFYRSLMEVKNTVDHLSEEQKHTASFWDDNPFTMNVSGHVMFATKNSPPGGTG